MLEIRRHNMTSRTIITTLFALTATGLIFAAVKGNYQITVDGSKHDIELGKEIVVKSKKGEPIHIIIDKKKIAAFQGEFVSFGYKNDMTVSSTDLDGGAKQIMIITGSGTIILIQEHSELNPAKVIDLCLEGLVKDQIEQGFRMTKKNTAKFSLTVQNLMGTKQLSNAVKKLKIALS